MKLLKSSDGTVAVSGPAIDAIRFAHERVVAAQKEIETAKGQLQTEARRFLMEPCSEAELIEKASILYWSVPEVPATEISNALFGDPKRIHKTLEMVTAHAPAMVCTRCSAEVKANSRSQFAASRASKQRSPFVCKECVGSFREQTNEEFIAERQAEMDRISALRSMPYREYLLTEEWMGTRNQKLRSAGYRCQLCNAGGLLNVHHRTYERRGCEYLRDLIVLCHPCHAKFHDKLPL